MVKVSLSKLLQLIVAIQACPVEIPKRSDKLFDSYKQFKASSDDFVSIAVSAGLERIVEVDVDEEDVDRKKKIIWEIISIYTNSKLEIPTRSAKIFLISRLQFCDICNGSLITVRPSRQGKSAVVYDKDGGKYAELYNKHCTQCLATVNPCYTEFKVGDITTRKYAKQDVKYFSITSETFFDTALLELLTEDVFTCDWRLSNFVEKLNRLNGDSIKLINKRQCPQVGQIL